MNPYDSPKWNDASYSDKMSPAIVERLIAGRETEELVVYDVSNHCLYGHKNRIRLTGDMAKRAEDAGCNPIVYQSVLWWCLVFIPVMPLGVFAVIPKIECDDPDGDADQYRSIRIAWDWNQIGIHYGVVFGTALLLSAIVHRL